MKPTAIPPRALVEQMLLRRLEGLDARGVAAFVAGWCAALEVVRRTDITMPLASEDTLAAVAELVDSIDRARMKALADPDEDPRV
jgi:hypothetical protein